MTKNSSIDARSFVAAQDFILSVKAYWTTQLYPQLDQSNPIDEIEQTVDYKFFAWLERHLQRFKYSGRYGIHRFQNQFRTEIIEKFSDNDLLILNEKLELPNYYTAVDIHQHPGGLWSDDIAGTVYERGARSTTPLGAATHHDLHHRLTKIATSNYYPDKILDMACGFGKSTQPFYDSFPKANIIGIDLSAPCLKLAAYLANQNQIKNVHYQQANAENTPFKNEEFNLVTSTMLLHELPPKSINTVFAEAHRVLTPGGKMVHLDFYLLPTEFSRFIHKGHSERNNEPFMEPFSKMDIKKILRDQGFTNISIEPFEEADGTLETNYKPWRFPWTVISAEKKA
ncbi:MAG: class I SAM-dependent methyltransferase [Pseudomonadota bacterium]|nr:class I SAM-dependent methyltransferase [Pseudomonadota bacterium]